LDTDIDDEGETVELHENVPDRKWEAVRDDVWLIDEVNDTLRIDNVFDDVASKLKVIVRLLVAVISVVGSCVTLPLVVQVTDDSFDVLMDELVVVVKVRDFECILVAVGYVGDRVSVPSELDERDIEFVLPETLFS
jgi:hypothetical protein